ncbi:hypothetical protein OAJ62_03550 [Pseudomonadota bacterium]|nr:hypothetical protein [Pseudomonadota bacterium]
MTKIFGFSILAILFFIIGSSNHDMWDGAITSYGFEISDISGSKQALIDHGWYLQYFLHLILFKLSDSLHLTFFQLSTFVSLILTMFMSREVLLLSKNIFLLEDYFAKLSFCLFILFPVWQIFFSSIHIIFILCILLGFVGSRYIHTEEHIILRSIGLVFIILSFQLSSMLVFIPVLSYAYQLNKKNINISFFPSIMPFSLFALSCSFYVVTKVIFPPIGEINQTYNQLINPFASKENFFLVFNSFKSYSSFLILLLPSLFLLAINISTSNSYLKFFCKRIQDNFTVFFSLIALLIASVFSYAMVGKASMLTIEYVMQWGMRHSILLAPVVAIFMAWFFQMILMSSPKSFKDRFSISLTILLSITFLFIGTASKLNRHNFEAQFVDALKAQNINPGNVYLVLDSASEYPIPTMRSYELNYLFYRTYGNIKYDVYFVREGNKALKNKGFMKEEIDRLALAQSYSKAVWLKELYDPSNTKCKSIILMEVKDFAGLSNVVNNTLGFNNGKINLALDSTKCVN